ncbi:unnamed protein product [Blepharisma stoltei]|uniref:Ribosome biogenesis regulatory protein n=1 Tax=Blepharisma stoltei TaxID=1481888 RepID=A0AAU9IEG5_9CILI|nr:unnamed protein product [Blepharisma stoltei]
MESTQYDENITYDLGNLAAYDISSLDYSSLYDVTSKNSSRLLAKLFSLEKEEDELSVLIKLPQPLMVLPREKDPPKPKPLNKWEKFRLSKGLGRRLKRSRMVYEPSVDDYLPRWGPYSVKRLHDKQTAIIEENEEGNAREKRGEEKSLKKLKQKENELKNKLSNAMEGKKGKKDIDAALDVAKSSTVKHEKQAKKRTIPRKDKNTREEKQNNLALLDQVIKKAKIST